MKNVYATFLLLVLITCSTMAGAQNLQWMRTYGGGYIQSLAITMDRQGNTITAGFFYGGINFGSTVGTFVANGASKDMFVCKHSALGTLLWAKAIGGRGEDSFTGVSVDSAENIYLMGTFQDTVDFNPDPQVMDTLSATWNDYSGFVLKLNAAGVEQWVRTIRSNSGHIGGGIATDAQGNVFASGEYNGPADFDPGPGTYILGSPSSGSVYVLALDAAGTFRWARSINEPGNNTHGSARGPLVALDSRHNVLLSGYYVGTIDVDPGAAVFLLTTVAGSGFDNFVLKLNPAGNLVWAKTLVGTANTSAVAICTDRHSNVYLTGSFEGKTDFNPGTAAADTFFLTTAGYNDNFILKLDSMGVLAWAKGIGDTLYDYGGSICTDTLGNVYTSGDFIGEVNFNPSATPAQPLVSTGYFDQFIMKMNSNGQFMWARSTGGANSHSFGTGIVPDNSGNVYTTGYFMNTVDFDPNAGTAFASTSVPSTDNFFLLKLGPWATSIPGGLALPQGLLSVAPVPTSGKANVYFENALNDASLDVLDATGRLLYRYFHQQGKELCVDLTAEPAGLYYLLIREGAKTWLGKVVRQ